MKQNRPVGRYTAVMENHTTIPSPLASSFVVRSAADARFANRALDAFCAARDAADGIVRSGTAARSTGTAAGIYRTAAEGAERVERGVFDSSAPSDRSYLTRVNGGALRRDLYSTPLAVRRSTIDTITASDTYRYHIEQARGLRGDAVRFADLDDDDTNRAQRTYSRLWCAAFRAARRYAPTARANDGTTTAHALDVRDECDDVATDSLTEAWHWTRRNGEPDAPCALVYAFARRLIGAGRTANRIRMRTGLTDAPTDYRLPTVDEDANENELVARACPRLRTAFERRIREHRADPSAPNAARNLRTAAIKLGTLDAVLGVVRAM